MVYQQHVTGRIGEDAACKFLQKEGYKILARNWRLGPLELDIVCQKKNELVFVEVKTRSAGSLEEAREALSLGKQKNLLKAMGSFLNEHDLWDAPARLDFICVTAVENSYNVEHLPNVLEFSAASGPVHCLNSSWQPW